MTRKLPVIRTRIKNQPECLKQDQMLEARPRQHVEDSTTKNHPECLGPRQPENKFRESVRLCLASMREQRGDNGTICEGLLDMVSCHDLDSPEPRQEKIWYVDWNVQHPSVIPSFRRRVRVCVQNPVSLSNQCVWCWVAIFCCEAELAIAPNRRPRKVWVDQRILERWRHARLIPILFRSKLDEGRLEKCWRRGRYG